MTGLAPWTECRVRGRGRPRLKGDVRCCSQFLGAELAGYLAWLINALAFRDKWATEAWGSRTYGLDAIASP